MDGWLYWVHPKNPMWALLKLIMIGRKKVIMGCFWGRIFRIPDANTLHIWIQILPDLTNCPSRANYLLFPKRLNPKIILHCKAEFVASGGHCTHVYMYTFRHFCILGTKMAIIHPRVLTSSSIYCVRWQCIKIVSKDHSIACNVNVTHSTVTYQFNESFWSAVIQLIALNPL